MRGVILGDVSMGEIERGSAVKGGTWSGSDFDW